MKKKIEEIKIDDASHPLRQMAIRIIEEVIEPKFCPDRGLNGESYYKMEDDLVALMSNLDLK